MCKRKPEHCTRALGQSQGRFSVASPPLACQAEGKKDSGAPRHVQLLGWPCTVGSYTSLATGFVVCFGPVLRHWEQTLPKCSLVKILLVLRVLGSVCCLSPSETVPLFWRWRSSMRRLRLYLAMYSSMNCLHAVLQMQLPSTHTQDPYMGRNCGR